MSDRLTDNIRQYVSKNTPSNLPMVSKCTGAFIRSILGSSDIQKSLNDLDVFSGVAYDRSYTPFRFPSPAWLRNGNPDTEDFDFEIEGGQPHTDYYDYVFKCGGVFGIPEFDYGALSDFYFIQGGNPSTDDHVFSFGGVGLWANSAEAVIDCGSVTDFPEYKEAFIPGLFYIEMLPFDASGVDYIFVGGNPFTNSFDVIIKEGDVYGC